MKGTAVVMMVLLGLCSLPSCSCRLYILVDIPKTWSEAQMYCRWKYTDLASVHNQQDLAELNQLTQGYQNVWIGLHADTEAWRWSLENQSYYAEGEAEFRNWNDGEPNGGSNYYKLCASKLSTGGWTDEVCQTTRPFICYNGIQNTSSSYILVTESKTWEEAQRYCRNNYIDLASVRNQAEDEQIKQIANGQRTWIGLYRDTWRWSDASEHSFSYWAPGAPSTTHSDSCVVSNSGKWVNLGCGSQRVFACYNVLAVRKQVVRVVLKKSLSSVDLEELKDGMLQTLNQRLRDHGLGEDVKLRWVERPDGKVFHKKRQKKEEQSCNLQ